MPKYIYECPVCKTQCYRHKRMESFNTPEFCARHNPKVPLTRIFAASFQICANREADKPENQLYKILTRGGGSKDQLELQRRDMARQEKADQQIATANNDRYVSVEEIVTKGGLNEAAKSGEVGINNWREANGLGSPSVAAN